MRAIGRFGRLASIRLASIGLAGIGLGLALALAVEPARAGAPRVHEDVGFELFDPTTGATRFDEPVGIAFASPGKAYVALSSRNRGNPMTLTGVTVRAGARILLDGQPVAGCRRKRARCPRTTS
jgi:hypothetical protein